MARSSRSFDWGFPRWRAYGGERGATQVRMCDRDGCDQPGDRPAPKSPNSPERWYFCEAHAAEYNKNWNYFEGLSAEEAAARESAETRGARVWPAAFQASTLGANTRPLRSNGSNTRMKREPPYS